MEQNIIINDKATINAIGELNSGHCKPVMCITTLTPFTSVQDAAKKYNISAPCISNVCNGKQNTAGGMEFCFLKDFPLYLDKIMSRYRIETEKQKQMEADAAVGRAIREAEEKRLEEERKAEEARLEAERKAEYERLKAIEKAEKARLKVIKEAEEECTKANKARERRQRMFERARDEYMRLLKRYEEAEQRSNEANARLMGLKGE